MHADGAELPDQGLQHLRTRTFGSLDAKAVGHALCELVRPSICPSSPLFPLLHRHLESTLMRKHSLVWTAST